MENYNQLTTEELKRWLDEGKDFVLLDVLSPESYAARHIPAAHNVPVGDSDFLEKAAVLAPDKETPVVAYCSSATCGASPAAAAKLAEAGYADVYHYKNGLAGWQEAGHSFEGETAE